MKAKSKGNMSQMDDLSTYDYDFDDETDESKEIEYGNRKLLRVNSPFSNFEVCR